VLLARRFGASALSDVYFVSNTAVSFIAAFGFFFTSMFMQYYNDLKVQDRTEATRFYQAVLNVSCILGFCIFVLVGLFSGPIIGVFVTGFDPERLTILTVFFRIVAFSLFSATVISLNNSLLNAEMKFMLPYILNLIQPAASISCLLVLVEPFGFYALAFCIVGSDLLALLVQQIHITKTLGIAPGREIRHKDLKRMAKKSFSMRIGSQIWSLRDPIATVIRTDVAFIVIYGILVFLTVGSFGVYAIPFSLMIAQFQNLMAYTANAKKIMGEQLWRTSLAAP
jgi:hypothetical protein